MGESLIFVSVNINTTFCLIDRSAFIVETILKMLEYCGDKKATVLILIFIKIRYITFDKRIRWERKMYALPKILFYVVESFKKYLYRTPSDF